MESNETRTEVYVGFRLSYFTLKIECRKLGIHVKRMDLPEKKKKLIL